MSTKVALEHRTTYRFDHPIGIGPHVIRLRPAPHTRTPIEAYTLQISPAEHFVNWQQDPFGNHVARVVFPSKSAELEITVGLVADLQVINPFDFFVEPYAERFPFTYPPDLAADLQPYLETAADARGPVLDEWLAERPAAGLGDQSTVGFLGALNAAVNADVGVLAADGGRGAHPRRDAQRPDRVVSRLGLAAGHRAAPLRLGRPLRLRVPGPARLRRPAAGRAGGPDGGLHRPARVGRGVRPRGRLDRARRDIGPVRRGGAHTPGRHPAPVVECPDHRGHRAGRDHDGLRQLGGPDRRGAADDAALHAGPAGPPGPASANRSTSG